ncbi:MAG: helix-turn-helix domain-containing protein [Desulforhopalus sp.]
MIRGLYYKGEKQQRYLTIDEIATACRISPRKVKGWVSQKILHSTAIGENLVAEDDVLTFLLQNNMPVVSSLLPPKTGKILFIAFSRVELRQKKETFDHICKQFAENYNLVLAESTTLGRPAHLSIMTFEPDVVVVFQKSFNKDLVETLDFLSTMPVLKTILIVDQATKFAFDNGLLSIPADLIVAESLPDKQLTTRLSLFFTS